jgi:hypothetical protein
MRAPLVARLALWLAFFVGQTFAIVHATQHELSDDIGAVSCDICAVASSGGPAPATISGFVATAPPVDAPSFVEVQAKVVRPVFLPPSRAPPRLPA